MGLGEGGVAFIPDAFCARTLCKSCIKFGLPSFGKVILPALSLLWGGGGFGLGAGGGGGAPVDPDRLCVATKPPWWGWCGVCIGLFGTDCTVWLLNTCACWVAPRGDDISCCNPVCLGCGLIAPACIAACWCWRPACWSWGLIAPAWGDWGPECCIMGDCGPECCIMGLIAPGCVFACGNWGLIGTLWFCKPTWCDWVSVIPVCFIGGLIAPGTLGCSTGIGCFIGWGLIAPLWSLCLLSSFLCCSCKYLIPSGGELGFAGLAGAGWSWGRCWPTTPTIIPLGVSDIRVENELCFASGLPGWCWGAGGSLFLVWFPWELPPPMRGLGGGGNSWLALKFCTSTRSSWFVLGGGGGGSSLLRIDPCLFRFKVCGDRLSRACAATCSDNCFVTSVVTGKIGVILAGVLCTSLLLSEPEDFLRITVS